MTAEEKLAQRIWDYHLNHVPRHSRHTFIEAVSLDIRIHTDAMVAIAKLEARLEQHKVDCLSRGRTPDGAYPNCFFETILKTKEKVFHGCHVYTDLERELAEAKEGK